MAQNPRPEYSARLKKTLEDRGLSQNQLAEILGVRASAVAMWTTRGSVPFRSTLSALCHLLEVRPEWLVDGKGPKDAPKAKDAFETFPKDLRSDLAELGEAALRSKDIRQVIAYQARTFRQP